MRPSWRSAWSRVACQARNHQPCWWRWVAGTRMGVRKVWRRRSQIGRHTRADGECVRGGGMRAMGTGSNSPGVVADCGEAGLARGPYRIDHGLWDATQPKPWSSSKQQRSEWRHSRPICGVSPPPTRSWLRAPSEEGEGKGGGTGLAGCVAMKRAGCCQRYTGPRLPLSVRRAARRPALPSRLGWMPVHMGGRAWVVTPGGARLRARGGCWMSGSLTADKAGRSHPARTATYSHSN